MSKLLGERELSPVATQLPVSWYFDPVIYQRELEVFFKRGPGYVGHELMVPNANDYRALEMTDGAWSLVRNAASVDLVSNVCRHRQAVMLKGTGNLASGNIVCPLHRWTYNGEGKLLGAPHFAEQPCLDLPRKTLQKWNGLLFQGPRDIIGDLGKLGCAKNLDFEGHVFNKVEVTEYNFNWKTFIEVYLEDYHVGLCHPGLGQFVDCDQLAWEFGSRYSVQTVGVNKSLQRPGSEVYRKWQESVMSFRGGEVPPFGAIWLTYYPNIMVEWYPHVLVISTIVPHGPGRPGGNKWAESSAHLLFDRAVADGGNMTSSWMLVAGALFATMGTFAKFLGAHFTGAELSLYRSLIALILLGAFVAVKRVRLATPFWKGHVWRGATGTVSLIGYFYAMTKLPLATAFTLNYTSPIFLTILSTILLREKFRRRLVFAIALGFIGVALLLRPTFEGENTLAGFIGLASGFFAACAYVNVKKLGEAGEPEWRVVFYFAVAGTIGSALFHALTGF